jgi:uncharacterized protein
MNARIVAELERIQGEHSVRALLAVESGSRAWGFARANSEYDVRLLYAHPIDSYLSITDPREVIEEMLPGGLNVCGWDLRKTLRQFSKCNVALNEWLTSPITYAESPEFRRQLAALIPAFFNPIAAMNHYCIMAERALSENVIDGRIHSDKTFYILRALYACRWIKHLQTQPPTEFDKLVDTEWVLEKDDQPGELGADKVKSIETELAHFKSLMTSLRAPAKSSTAPLDVLLRNWAIAR